LPSLQLKLAELERQSAVNTQIHSQVLNRYNQAKIADVTEVTDVYVLDYAVAPVPPSDFVNVLILLGIGVLIALAISLAPPVIVDFFDKTVRTESELKNILTFTVLESIPTIKISSGKSDKGKKVAPHTRTIDKKLITSDFTHDFTNELFRSLRAKIMLKLFDQPRKRILVTSHGMGEGKSLVSSNLAITMAQQKLSTVLIDGDIRRGVQHNSFLLSKKPGLSSFLFSEDPVTVDSVTSLLQKTHVQNLSLIASGPNVPNPSELLGHPRFEQLINALSAMFDVIIFDTPPIGLAADAALVSNLFSASVIVIRAGVTDVIDLRKKLDEFPNLKKSVIGLVLNEALLDRRLRNYKYSSYYYNTETNPENSNSLTKS
jgi:tyrosine-protein kinase Etk/Wzc